MIFFAKMDKSEVARNKNDFKAMKKIENETCIKFEDRSKNGHEELVSWPDNIREYILNTS